MPSVRLPTTLPLVFPGLPRELELEATTVEGAIAALDARWPGLRDRLCEPGPALRRHLSVFVDGTRAQLETPLHAHARVEVVAAISGG
jgi:molybdopterin converting factor small subunit